MRGKMANKAIRPKYDDDDETMTASYAEDMSEWKGEREKGKEREGKRVEERERE